MNGSRLLVDPRRIIVPLLLKKYEGGWGPKRNRWGPMNTAISGSGLFVKTFLDVLDTTQLALDLDLETHKGALFTNSITNDFSADTAYGVAPFDANETSGADWSAGGIALTGTTFTEAASGKAVFDGTDVSKANSTLAAAECYLLYADALAGNNAIVLVDFTAPVSCTAGTFEILWVAPASGGIFNIDLVP